MKVTIGAGNEAIGAQLRRLSEIIDRDAGRAYEAFNIDFEQRWFGVLNQLFEKGSSTVGQIANELHITHVSVSQTRQSLHKAGLIRYESNPSDGRQRLLKLSAKGHAFVEQLQPLWKAMIAASIDIDAEADHVVERLDKLETALKRKSIFERIMERVDMSSDFEKI